MALITCPQCGKSVSDTVEVCIHCGASLKNPTESVPPESGKEQYNIEEEYYKLPFERQAELKDEFNRQFPKYAQVKDLGNLYLGLYVVGYILFFIFLLLYIFKCSLIYLILFVCSDVIFILIPSLLRQKNKKKNLIVLKKYQTWLLRSKNIVYKVTFTGRESKWQKIYDSISDTEDI